MSFIPDPDLTLATPCYLNGISMFIYSQKVATTKTGTKVQYQVTEQLPDDYTDGKGPYPHPASWYDRTNIETPPEYFASELARIEAEANEYYRTLTGKPYVWLYGDSTETIAFDSTTEYIDAGFYITDLEDGTSNVIVTDMTGDIFLDSTSAVVSGVIDLSIPATYLREYYAVDVDGNESDIVSRLITVEAEPLNLPDC